MSAKQQKDKRTKEQILRLLDNAIEQEERLSGKIKSLETELADCRKKAENPRHELTEEALPASKVSFRIDYYRTAESGPLKGIIEHLPSRQNKAFEGEGQLVIGHFMNRFLMEETGNTKKKAVSEKQHETEKSSEIAVAPIKEAVAERSERKPAEEIPQASELPQTPASPTKTANEAPNPNAGESDNSESRLLHKVRAKFAAEFGTGETVFFETPRQPVRQQSLPAAAATDAEDSKRERVKKSPPLHLMEHPTSRPSLLERVREEFQKSLVGG